MHDPKDWRTSDNSVTTKRPVRANGDEVGTFHRFRSIPLPHAEKLMRRAAQQTERQRQAAQANHN